MIVCYKQELTSQSIMVWVLSSSFVLLSKRTKAGFFASLTREYLHESMLSRLRNIVTAKEISCPLILSSHAYIALAIADFIVILWSSSSNFVVGAVWCYLLNLLHTVLKNPIQSTNNPTTYRLIQHDSCTSERKLFLRISLHLHAYSNINSRSKCKGNFL